MRKSWLKIALALAMCVCVVLALTACKCKHKKTESAIENEIVATCVAQGSYDEVKYCKKCGEELSRSTTYTDKLAHTPGDWTTVTEATCFTEGTKHKECSVCGTELETGSIDKIEHTPAAAVRENEVAASCTVNGSYDEVVYCVREGCGAELSRENKVIPAPGHTPGTPVVENSEAANCFEGGSYDEVVYCSVSGCGVELSRTPKTVPATGAHIPAAAVRENEVAATCTVDGSYDEVVYCSVPGCGHEISREAKVILAPGHHTPAAAVTENRIGATCLVDGSYDEVVYCSVPSCGTELSRETKVILAPGHHTPAAAVTENRIGATCTVDGSYDEVVYCSASGCRCELSRESKVITASHNYKVGICTVCGEDQPPSSGLGYSVYSDETCGVRNMGDCTDTSIVIPEWATIGMRVTGIFSAAFYECTSIESVIIPSSVINIDSYAFYGCTSLTNVTIPNGVTSIGEYAFSGCTSLTSITIPDSVTSIGKDAFKGCTRLKSVTIGNGVSIIPQGLLSGCSSLESLTIPFVGGSRKTVSETYQYPLGYIFGTSSYSSGVATQQYYYGSSTSSTTNTTYYIPSSLKSVTVTSGNIPYGAFYNCARLTSVTIGDGVTSIGSNAFYNCTGLARVYITDIAAWCGISFGNDYANPLCYAKNLYLIEDGEANLLSGDLVIPDGITSIARYAFKNCTGLTSVSVPNSVTSIGEGAFFGCSSLESLTIPFVGDSRKTSSDRYQYPLGYIFGTKSYSGGVATKQYYYGSSTSSVTNTTYYIPASLKSITVTDGNILYGAFRGCTNLTSVTIGSGITSIGSDAFYDCAKLKEVYITDIAAWCGMSFGNEYANPLRYANKLYLIEDGEAKPISGDLVIPDGVTSIVSCMFKNCTEITNITIPNSVTSIGSYAFYDCTGLTSVTIPDSVTSIGSYAFAYCAGLTSVTIGSDVESIGSDAFYNCTGLSAVYITDIAAWCNISFGGDTANPLYYAENLYLDGELITELVIPNGVTVIPIYAFKGQSNITSVRILNSVTSIGSSAFSGCTSLKSIDIPNSVTSIGGSAFSGCSSLESLTIPFVGGSRKTSSDTYQYPFGYIFGTSSYGGGVATKQYYYGSSTSGTTISTTTYYIPASLKSVTVTGGNILYGAFYNCIGLASIEIPSSVTSISEYAFSGCTALTSITIPSNVTSIGKGALAGCSSLESLTIPFVGGSIKTASDTYQYPLGYIFGTRSYGGGVATRQYFVTSTSTTPYSEFYIPASLKSVTVTGGNILGGAFYNCTTLTSVTIPESVTSIGSNTFYNCTGLTSITIPNSVTSISESAFRGCTGLTSVTIPESVTSIGRSAFSGCTGLEEIYFNATCMNDLSSSNYVFSHAGQNGDGIKVIIGNNVTKIPAYLFFPTAASGYEPKIVSVEFEEGSVCESIGNHAFSYCTSLTSVTIPESVTSIGNSAFYGCYHLAEVINKSSLTITKSSLSNGGVGYYALEIHNGESKIVDKDGYLFYTCEGVNYLVGYIGEGEVLVLPESYNGENYKINQFAFYERDHIASVTIGSGVTSIGNHAFSYCTSLTSVTIGNSVISIGDDAFRDCTGLTSVTIPNSVTSIGNSAFYGCTGLTSINIPDGVTSIGSSAFYNCTGLEEIYFNAVAMNDLSSNNYVFYDAGKNGDGIKIVIGKNVTKIPAYLFHIYDSSYAPKITSVEFEEGSVCESIGNYAFYYCTGLTSITIPSRVTSIGEGAFRYCASLTSVAIPNSVTSIGSSAFYYCTGLTSVTIGSGVESIGSSAFQGCYKLVEVINKSSLTITKGSSDNGYIGKYAFYVHSGESKIDNVDGYLFITSEGENYLLGYIGEDKELTLPESYKGENYVIHNYAFYERSDITSVDIPNSVTSIGNYAFSGCTGIEEIYFDAVAMNNLSSNNYVFAYAGQNGGGIKVVIGKNVTKIPAYLFYPYGNSSYAPKITSVEFEEGSVCESIGERAFAYCYDLTSATIPNSVTSIGPWAFYYCTGLTSVTIGSGVTSIGSYAFYSCTGLNAVYITDIAAWCNISFGDEYANPLYYAKNLYLVEDEEAKLITDLVIPNGATSIGSYAFYSCTGLTSVTIGSGVTSIGGAAFYGCTSLTIYCEASSKPVGWNSSWNSSNRPVVWGCNNVTTNSEYDYVLNDGKASLTKYKGSAIEVVIPSVIDGYNVVRFNDIFANNTSITSVTIPDTVAVISPYAFYGCTGLKSVTIGSGVTSIGSSAFYNCDGLTSVTIGSSVTSIGDCAFSGCAGLTSIDIPNRVTSIGDSAFSGCAGLTSVTIGTGVKSIGTFAFGYCASLTSITLPNSVTSIGNSAFYRCTGLTSVTIPSNVTSIGSGAFYGCTGLTSVTFVNPNSWWYASSADSTSGTSISATDLENASTAATYLKSTYRNYYWKK